MAGKASFDFEVKRKSGGSVKGKLGVPRRRRPNIKVKSVKIQSLTITGNVATFSGTCKKNGNPCTFTATVTDNGKPGTNDRFQLSVSGGPSVDQNLISGNIKVKSSAPPGGAGLDRPPVPDHDAAVAGGRRESEG